MEFSQIPEGGHVISTHDGRFLITSPGASTVEALHNTTTTEQTLPNIFSGTQHSGSTDVISANGVMVHRHFQHYIMPTHMQIEQGLAPELAEFVQVQRPSMEVNMFPQTSPYIENLSQFSLGQQYEFSHNVSQAFSTDLSMEPESNVDGGECVTSFSAKTEDRERALLHSSMSPLLAAVNDITKRDAELQLYLSQALERESSEMTEKELLPVQSEPVWANTSNTEMECRKLTKMIYLFNGFYKYIPEVVTDKPVDCRARASLPTRYLQFGQRRDSIDPYVFAKKLIRHCTKFGPCEGVIRFTNTIELDLMQIQGPRLFPLLLIDETHILDVSNEDNSNWMRYIRLAESYEQQNLQVVLEQGNIFFKSMRNIQPMEELRVGYNSVYATRFMLPVHKPTESVKLPGCDSGCVECREQRLFHAKIEKASRRRRKGKSRVRKVSRNPIKRSSRIARQIKSCQLCVRRCDSKKNLKRSVKKPSMRSKVDYTNRQRPTNIKLMKTLYECSECRKEFRTERQLQRHKKQHTQDMCDAVKFMCSMCPQLCSTPTALRAHEKSHESSFYSCIYCEQQFKYVREFKTHENSHLNIEGKFECPHCQKIYKAYHLVRKHVRLFHSCRQLNCAICDKKFCNVNNLRRHELTHAPSKLHKCVCCQSAFARKDQLRAHTKRLHSDALSSLCIVPEIPDNTGSSVFMEKSDISPALTLKEQNACKSINALVGSSSNRRKQVPTKLKKAEINPNTDAFAAVSDIITPFLISEHELHEEFVRPEKLSKKQAEQDKKISERPASPVIEISHCERGPDAESEDKAKSKPDNTEMENPLYPFKCHLCRSVLFKRRGILVNHYANRHPNVNMQDIEILNRPLHRPQMTFSCLYCSNVYKSNAKRKCHILKHHPGQQLPLSLRDTQNVQDADVTVVGNVEVVIYSCTLCPCQYASRNRLVSHYNRVHPEAKVNEVERAKPSDHEFDNQQCHVLEPEVNITSYTSAFMETENKLLKLSSAALELSRFDFLNDRTNEDFNKLTSIFEEQPLSGMDSVLVERANQRSIEAQFFEKIGKL